MKSIILIVSVLFSLNGCGGDDTFKTTSITYTEIGKGEIGPPYLNNGNSVNRVIDNLDEWKNLINEIDHNPSNVYVKKFTEVDIDFSKYQVIVIFDSETKSPPSETNIKTITEYDNEIIVKYETVGLMDAIPHLGQSFHIVKILSSKKLVKFQKI